MTLSKADTLSAQPLTIVGLSGGLSSPSRTLSLVELALRRIIAQASMAGLATTASYNFV